MTSPSFHCIMAQKVGTNLPLPTIPPPICVLLSVTHYNTNESFFLARFSWFFAALLCKQLDVHSFCSSYSNVFFFLYLPSSHSALRFPCLLPWLHFIIPIYRCVFQQRPPHNREVVGSIPGRVIPKDVKRWEFTLFGVQHSQGIF